MIIVYGIKNCDTIKKTGQHLTSCGLPWQLHDYRKDGLDDALCAKLLSHFTTAEMINTRGTTWRQLSSEQQSALLDTASSTALLKQFCAVIKRPIICTDNKQWLIGFDALVKVTDSLKD
jgi:Spx/MgsR family transcriptional regulator